MAAKNTIMQQIGVRPTRWTSLRIMLLQAAVSVVFTWIFALYGSSATYPGLPSGLQSAFGALSYLIPITYGYMNATTGNAALVRDCLIAIWFVNLTIGVVHLILLRDTEKILLLLRSRLASAPQKDTLLRAIWLFPVMLLLMSVLSMFEISAIPVLVTSGGTTEPNVLGLSAQACAASVLWFCICNLLALRTIQRRANIPTDYGDSAFN